VGLSGLRGVALGVSFGLIVICAHAGQGADPRGGLQEVLAGSAPVPASPSVWEDVREFYRQREDFPAWLTDNTTARAHEALEALRMAPAHGLSTADYADEELLHVLDSRSKANPVTGHAAAARSAMLEARVSVALFTLARDIALGRTVSPGRGHLPTSRRRAPDFVGLLAAANGDPTRWLDLIRPRHPEYAALQGALAALRAQPATSGPLDASVASRIATLATNLERWRWMPDDLGARHVLVNIPAFRLTARENGRTALDMGVIVGKPATKTPAFSGEMATLVFSPYWNIPDSILVGEMAPQAARDPTFLARNDIEVLRRSTTGATSVDPSTIDWSDRPSLRQLEFRQRPGPKNALGLVKFLFPNEFDVYLHDTPTRKLFTQAVRAFSHGCVRVEQAQALAQWVLRDEPGWDEARILRAMRAGVEQHLRLSHPLPVHIVYFTAWVDEVGAVHLERDIYGYDS
jgi:murein L,D-transpeptidase YcbB/YkuD